MPYTMEKGATLLMDSPLATPNLSASPNLWTLNFGPQHPATHTVIRLVLEIDGERVVRCVPVIGYLHSGFEKNSEVLDYNQNMTIVDRMDYLAPMGNELSWIRASELLFGVEPTPRCIHEAKSTVMTIFFRGRTGGLSFSSQRSLGPEPAGAARIWDNHGLCQASIRRQPRPAGIASVLVLRGRPHSRWRGRLGRLMHSGEVRLSGPVSIVRLRDSGSPETYLSTPAKAGRIAGFKS